MSIKQLSAIIIATLSLLTHSTGFCAELPDTNTKPNKGTVALTFDDGPAVPYTQQILDILDRYDIKATFFIVGANAKTHPEVLKAIHNRGHVIAQHSMTHPMLTRISATRLEKEITGPQVVVEHILDISPKCLRYPFGMSNKRVRAAIAAHGIHPVDMGFNSFDYKRKGVQTLASWVIKNARDGQVILLHDGYKRREQTVKALPLIIEGIKKKGLGFSTICG